MRTVPLLLLVGLLGCEKKAENRIITKPLTTQPVNSAYPLLDSPAKSDVVSLEIVNKIVAAHTGSNPSTLARLKGILLSREGTLTMKDAPVSGLPVKYVWQATWPGKGRYVWQGMAPIPLTFRIIDRQVWLDGNQPLPEQKYEDVIRENYGIWLQTPIPLTEPDSIVAPGPDFQSATQTLKGLRIWRPGMAQAIVYYDPKTHLIGRVAYDGRDSGMPAFFELSLYDHKPMSGYQIAERLYVRKNGNEFMEFTKVDLAIAQDHPAKLFTEP